MASTLRRTVAILLLGVATLTSCSTQPSAGPFDGVSGILAAGPTASDLSYFDGSFYFDGAWADEDLRVISAAPIDAVNLKHNGSYLAGPNRTVGSWVFSGLSLEETPSHELGSIVPLPAPDSLHLLMEDITYVDGSVQDQTWALLLDYQLIATDAIGHTGGIELRYILNGEEHLDRLKYASVVCGPDVEPEACNQATEDLRESVFMSE